MNEAVREALKAVGIDTPPPNVVYRERIIAQAVVREPGAGAGTGNGKSPLPPMPIPDTIETPTNTPETAPPTGVDDSCLYWPSEPPDFTPQPWMRFALECWDKCPDVRMLILAGPPGTGKSLLAEVLSARMGIPMIRINCSKAMDADSLMGHSEIINHNSYFLPGPFVQGAALGAIVNLEEFTLLARADQQKINGLTDRIVGGVYIPQTGKMLRWENPRIILTCNPGLGGNQPIAEAALDRCAVLIAEYLPERDETQLLYNRTGAPWEILEKAVKTAAMIRTAAAGRDPNGTFRVPLNFHLSPRRLMEFGSRLMAGQNMDRAWLESVVWHVELASGSAGDRDCVIQLSKVGGFLVE